LKFLAYKAYTSETILLLGVNLLIQSFKQVKTHAAFYKY